MTNRNFKLSQTFTPAGDQVNAIKELIAGFKRGIKEETLLGVTGSGKTFTAANVIAAIDKPTLVIAHNKTLAAQLAQEYSEFFPENSVHYFVSYYDYYQPEAYLPVSDTYIEKEAQINEEIDRLRHSSTQALLTRRDVIIVASVSCIYGLGSPEEYLKVHMKINRGDKTTRRELMSKLVDIYYTRQTADLLPGTFRAIGNSLEIMPVNEKIIWRIELEKDIIQGIYRIDDVSRAMKESDLDSIFIFPAKHFVSGKEQVASAIKTIQGELKNRLYVLEKSGKILEAERLKRRTNYDLALIREIGYCNGIENYSRHFSGKNEGDAPDTLLSYFPHKPDGTPDFLTIIDESHVTLPQLGAMYAGDQSRKENLVEHGFRLPSAKDNRPLKYDEFSKKVGMVLYTSATPSQKERERSGLIVEQVIRPTGLIDPLITVRPITGTKTYKGQVENLISEIVAAIKKGERTIVTTLTKKMAEDLSEYLQKNDIETKYIHSEIKTMERIEILSGFRKGVFDCLVGVNLLREGLDLPEVALIGILDADKEGFLRSETSLIQIIGRAARNVNGRVILYADTVTKSMEYAIRETERRRKLQLEYNKKNGITPRTIEKKIKDITERMETEHQSAVKRLLEVDIDLYKKDKKKLIREKEQQMNDAVKILDFETAAIIRDEIKILKRKK